MAVITDKGYSVSDLLCDIDDLIRGDKKINEKYNQYILFLS